MEKQVKDLEIEFITKCYNKYTDLYYDKHDICPSITTLNINIKKTLKNINSKEILRNEIIMEFITSLLVTTLKNN